MISHTEDTCRQILLYLDSNMLFILTKTSKTLYKICTNNIFIINKFAHHQFDLPFILDKHTNWFKAYENMEDVYYLLPYIKQNKCDFIIKPSNISYYINLLMILNINYKSYFKLNGSEEVSKYSLGITYDTNKYTVAILPSIYVIIDDVKIIQFLFYLLYNDIITKITVSNKRYYLKCNHKFL